MFPLDGITILEFGHFIAGPGAALALADLGANVLKVESLQGDHARGVAQAGDLTFANFNRGKKSIAVDLRDSRVARLVRQLAVKSDVVIQSLRPGVLAEFGLGCAELRKLNPRLIYASLSGFGSKGPSASRPGFDIAAQAESGMMWINGDSKSPPTRVGFVVVDVGSTYVLSQAILAALFNRERMGIGAELEVSLLNVAMHLQGVQWAGYLQGGPEPMRRGNGHAHAALSAELIETRDGYIVLSAYLQDHWRRLCVALERDDLLKDRRFVTNELRTKNRHLLMEVLSPSFKLRSTADVVLYLASKGIVVASVNNYSQASNHPDVIAEGMIRTLGKPEGGTMEVIRAPFRCSDWGEAATELAPKLGQDTRRVLTEMGCQDAELDELIRDGVIQSDSTS